MVTVAIAERGNVIAQMLKQAFYKKNINFCQSALFGDGTYCLLDPKANKNCDIALLHNSAACSCSADYMTLLNANEHGFFYNKKSVIITYGLNSLATVTASSIHADEGQTRFQCCIQRSFVSLKGLLIEPQEFPVHIPFLNDIDALLGFVTLGLTLSFLPADFI
ncbi:MAG: hypothetical protein IKW06_02745 [Clostridia bacterium]|nr:hypothetical protein [Clostridia bacterium]